jgi:hypothetical protein
MTSSSVLFRDLKKFVSEQQQQQQRSSGQSTNQQQFSSLKGLPFYRWDISEEEHRRLAVRRRMGSTSRCMIMSK